MMPYRKYYSPLSLVLKLPAICVIAGALIGCGINYSPTTKNGSSASFTYSGSKLLQSPGQTAITSTIPSTYFGMTIHYLASNAPGANNGPTPFPPFKVSTLRFWDVASWLMLEPSKGVFNWAKMDEPIAVAKQNHVNDFIFTFGSVPQWASTNPSDPCANAGWGPGTCAPPDLDALDDFAVHVVRRYCGTVKYFEPWNEPNVLSAWDGTKAELLTVAQHVYRIARDSANCGCTDGVCSPNGGVNPNQVLLPSVANLSLGDGIAWIDSYLATSGPQYPYADIASFHGYIEPDPQGSVNPECIVKDVENFRQILAKHGLANLELWNTEASWGSETAAVSQEQASWLMRYHAAQLSAGVSRFIWYAYDNCDYGTLWSTSPCNNPGAPANQLTDPGEAYRVLESWLTEATLNHCDNYQNGLWACELQRPGGYEGWMLWSSTGESISVPIPSNSNLVVRRDWQNDVSSLPETITVDKMPVLLENHDL